VVGRGAEAGSAVEAVAEDLADLVAVASAAAARAEAGEIRRDGVNSDGSKAGRICAANAQRSAG
jgi:hypothetical protein